MPSVLITGANRGMGVEHARQYAEDGWRTYACCRSPASAEKLTALAAAHENLTVHALDLTDQTSIEALKAELGDTPIDVLLSNASHLGDLNQQRFGDKQYDTHEQSFAVNALGPFRMAEAFIDNVRASDQKKMMFVTSKGGSIGSLQPPVMLFAYCPGKAALNMYVRGLHLNLGPEGITVGLLEPGVVDTQGFADVKPGEPAPHGLDVVVEMVQSGQMKMASPADAVKGLRARIAAMTPADGGVSTEIDGSTIPW